MKAVAWAVLILVIAIVAYFLFLQNPAETEPRELILDCSVERDLEPLCGFKWMIEGEAKVDYPRISLEATLTSKSSGASVPIEMVTDGESTFMYGTFEPVSSPTDLRWYDVTDVNVPCLSNLTGQIELFLSASPDSVCSAPGIVCDRTESVPGIEFSMPDASETSRVPAGGAREYYA